MWWHRAASGFTASKARTCAGIKRRNGYRPRPGTMCSRIADRYDDTDDGRYSHVMPCALREASGAIDRVLRGQE